MSSFVTKLVVTAAVAALAIGSVACHIGEAHEEVEYYDAHLTSASVTCGENDYVKADLSKLTKCGGSKGPGHCYDRLKTPISGPVTKDGPPDDYKDDACKDGEVCIPDTILESNGKPLQTCDFMGNQGVCMSRIAQRIDDNAKSGVLKQENCKNADEVCVPCKDPTAGNKDIGICKAMGVHSNECNYGSGNSGITLCCHGMGLCTETSAVPGGHADDLPADSSCKPSQVCAPAAMVDNKPHKCSGALGIKGVCLDYCFADMLQGAKALERGDCQATEICLPCALGKSQGMPGCD